MALDIVDDLLPGRRRRVASLGIEEHIEPSVRRVAPVVGLAGAEEVEEIAVHFAEERRWPPGDLVELSEEGSPDVTGVVLVDDGEVHADLLEASGQELELLDVVRAIARPAGALDPHAVGKTGVREHLPGQRGVVLEPPCAVAQLGR